MLELSKSIKVSTITPCFRMKPYLKKFLEELPSQTLFNELEIILDHNEPDNEEIVWVKEFNRQYPGKIKHIIVPKVEPIGASMNRCIKEASGEFVTIWNVDDLRTPNSIELQVKALEEKDGDIAIGDFKIVRKFGEKEKGTIIAHAHVPESEFKRSMYYGPFLMFKKSLCDKAGYFDEQLTSGADFDLSIRLAYNGKTVVANDLLGYYLNEGKGASTRPNSKQALDKAVIELRYGIFDKLDLSKIPQTVSFDIPHILSFGKRYPVEQFVPEYRALIENNAPTIKSAIYRTALHTATSYPSFRYKIKTALKKMLHK